MKLTTVCGAPVLDAHFDWPAQEIVDLFFICCCILISNLITVSGAPVLDAHFEWPVQEIVAFRSFGNPYQALIRLALNSD